MGRKPKAPVEEWVDAFLPLLQRQTHQLQDERTHALRQIEVLQARVEEIGRDLKIMEAECVLRTHRPSYLVPDFPPDEPSLSPAHPASGNLTQEDLEESGYDGSMVEEVEYQDYFDNSEFATSGHVIFGPYPGIQGPIKTRAYSRATLHVVRDWVANWGKDWFKNSEVVHDTRFSPSVVRNRLYELQDMDVVEHNGIAQGGSMWRYNANLPKGPTSHPVQDKPTAKVGGTPVPHTRAVGRSGKPGLDKRRARQGKKVKRGKVGS